MKILNISHNDLDGVTCTIITKLLFGDKAEIRNVSNMPAAEMNAMYAEILEKADEYDQVFITDLSVPPKSAELMDKYNQENRPTFYICDHHKSNIENKRYDMAYILSDDKSETDLPECGASIYRNVLDVLICESHEWFSVFDPDMDFVEHIDYIHGSGVGKTLDRFIELVRLWDTYQWEDIENKELGLEAKLLNDLYSHTNQEYLYDMILCEPTAPVACTHSVIPIDTCNLLGAMKESTVKRVASRIRNTAKILRLEEIPQIPERYYITSYNESPNELTNSGAYSLLLITGNEYAGNVREAIDYIYASDKSLPEGWPERRIDVFMIWDIDKGSFQIRVSNDNDCNFDGCEFAKFYGGGGHNKASGVTYNRLDDPNINPNVKELCNTFKKYIF